MKSNDGSYTDDLGRPGSSTAVDSDVLEAAIAEIEEQVRSLVAPECDSDARQASGHPALRANGSNAESVVGHRRGRSRLKKGTARRRAAESRMLAASFLYEEIREEKAQAALAAAMAQQHPLVRECVCRRLLDRWSHERLALELGLTRRQVESILNRLRAWVARFTDYFEHDSYWLEGDTITAG